MQIAIAAAESDLKGSFNPLMNMVIPQLLMFERRRRDMIAGVRILRMAVADVRGEKTQFADPYGDTLRAKAANGRTHYWSVGENGKDDGGDPKKDLLQVR